MASLLCNIFLALSWKTLENSLFVGSNSIQESYHHFQMDFISNFLDPRNCSLLEMCDVQFAKRETSDRLAVNKQDFDIAKVFIR